MAIMAAIFFVEKNVRFGDLLLTGAGVAWVVGGVLLLVIA
jgi:hypothetical protein